MRAALAALLLSFCLSVSQAAIYIVRHAEKKDPKQDKSLLSRAGKKRAQTLKRVLASVDLKAVYCTEYERTQQTAAPVAEEKKLKPAVIDSEDEAGLVKALLARPASEDVLVVGHSDTIPGLLKRLGVARPVAIAPGDFDNLFVVTPSSGVPPAFSWLHY